MDEATSVAVEALWQTCLAFAKQLEERLPGICEAVHDDLVTEASLADVVRLRGKREERFLVTAAAEAARRVGEIVVLSHSRPRKKERRG